MAILISDFRNRLPLVNCSAWLLPSVTLVQLYPAVLLFRRAHFRFDKIPYDVLPGN